MCECLECQPHDPAAIPFPRGILSALSTRLDQIDAARQRLDQERVQLLSRYVRLTGHADAATLARK